jgi:4-alpha-glucanotransferase
VLLPLSALRRRDGWGCGDLGDLAPFGRWAARAGLHVVQILPVTETTGLDPSPYSGASTFAIDPVYLDLDACDDFIDSGGRAALPAPLLAELATIDAGRTIAWTRVRALKAAATRRAFEHFLRSEWEPGTARAQALREYMSAQKAWLDDYTLFAVLHAHYHKSWLDWPEELRQRRPEALAAARATYALPIVEQAWLQWQLERQWQEARAKLADLGVGLMGDLPFAPSMDSADVWSNREVFRTDLTVGTPPDQFSEIGQDWGLPAYDWDYLKETDFAWMRARAARAGAFFSAYRVDHVIGLYRTFVREEKNAPGRFSPAEEAAQIANGEAVLTVLGEAGEVIAEDLGAVPKFLPASLEKLDLPGYKLLRWQKPFDSEDFLAPSTWPVSSVSTNGTHDTDTSAEWYDGLADGDRMALARLPGLELFAEHPQFDDAVRDALLAALYAAPSELTLTPFQDLFGHRERVNVPGTESDDNWIYRLPVTIDALEQDAEAIARLRMLAVRSGRASSD